MKDRKLFNEEYLKTVEHLLKTHGNNKDLNFTLYEGSLQQNNYSVAARMAGKMALSFGEPSYILPQVQCLYMDSQKWLGGTGNPMSINLAVAFAERHMKAL